MKRNNLARLLNLPRRFRRDENGAAAVEFAFIAAPFFGLIFAIVELSIAFFTNQALETGVQDVSRLIRTGQAAKLKLDEPKFKTALCDALPVYINCKDKVEFDVKSYSNFNAAINTTLPAKNGVIDWQGNRGFDMGKPGDVVVVRVVYPIPTYTNYFGAQLANLDDGRLLLMSTVAFRNEPDDEPVSNPGT